MLAERSWQPVLMIGDAVFADRIATVDGGSLSGDVDGIASAREPLQTFSSGMAGLLSGLNDTIAGQAGGAQAPADLVGEWLVFRIEAPGGPAVEHRRALFDLVGTGPATVAIDETLRRRRTEGLLEQVEIGLWGATPSVPFVADGIAREAATLFATVAYIARAGGIDAVPALGSLPRSQALLHGFAAGRAGLAGDAELVVDRPNLVLLRQGQRLATSGSSASYAAFDIVENGIAAASADAVAAFDGRLRQGVADTALESALLGAPSPSHNAAVLFADDMAAGRAWVTLSRPGDEAAIGLPPVVAAEVAAALRAGYLAVVPQAPPPTGAVAWWRVDPATGTTLGIGPTGAGSEFVEYLTLLGKIIGFAGCTVGAISAAGHVESTGGAVVTGAAYAFCMLGMGLTTVASLARILFVTTPLTEAAIAANAAAWAGADAIGGLVGAGVGAWCRGRPLTTEPAVVVRGAILAGPEDAVGESCCRRGWPQ
ncbi:MAG: hypothetical protein R3F55_21300 [Alphaproteobacteria bacterium]